MGKILRLEEVPLGEPLGDSLYDTDGVLLMGIGSIVTSEKIRALATRGLRYLELGAPSDRSSFQTAITVLEQDATAPAESWTSDSDHVVELDGINEALRKTQGNIRPIDASFEVRVSDLVARAAATVEDLGKQLADGTLRDATPIRNIAEEFLRSMQHDSDQTICTALKQTADAQLAVRSVQMSVLAIAIARAMRMTTQEQAKVGSAGLLHDMALFELPENERHSPELMRPESRRIYESHPAIAYDRLELVRDIDGTVRIIVLQAHEQADGSGFPRGITITRTHRLARVLNLADAYLTLIGCGPGSKKIFPADAIAYLMHHSCQGRFDSEATCGLVRALSLYPVGSLVKLTDCREARVVRTTPSNPMMPIVQTLGEDHTKELVSLENSDLAIDSLVDEDCLQRRRLSATDLVKVLW